MTKMRAKMRVGSIQPIFDTNKEKAGEQLYFHGVAKNGQYPDDGSDEDNLLVGNGIYCLRRILNGRTGRHISRSGIE